MQNLFFGAYPDAEEAAQIYRRAERLDRNHRLGGNLIESGRLHTTLVEYTEVREAPKVIIDSSLAAGSSILMPAFDVSFDRVLSFPNRRETRPLVLAGGEGVGGLVALQRALIKALHNQWLKIPANPGYIPHMTLLYSKHVLPEESILPLRWRVRGFALVQSHAGQGRHEILGRWPLRDPDSIDTGVPSA